MQKALYILSQLNDTDVEWMIAQGTKQYVEAGTTLIQENVEDAALYFVLDGEFAVTVGSPPRELALLEAGEVLGEMSFVSARPPSATVSAVRNSFVLSIPRDILHIKIKNDSDFASRFYRAVALFLSYRLRDTMGYGEVELIDPSELDAEIMDQLYLAGLRFDRILKLLK